MSELKLLEQSLSEHPVLSHHLRQVLQCLKFVMVPSFCPFTLMVLILFAINMVFRSLNTISTLCTFCRDFHLGLLDPALPQICNISAAFANLSIMFSRSIRRDPFEENICLTPADIMNHPAIHLDSTCNLVIDLLNGANSISIDIVFSLGGPKGCNSVNGFFLNQ